MKKAVEEYKSSNEFLDDIVEQSIEAFHEGFKDCQSKVRKLFPIIGITLLILSVPDMTVEVAMGAQDIRMLAKDPPPTTFKAATVAKAVEAPVDAPLDISTDQAAKV